MRSLGKLIEARLERIDARNSQLETRLPLWTPREAELKLARAQREQRRVMRSGDLPGYLKQRNDRDNARARRMA